MYLLPWATEYTVYRVRMIMHAHQSIANTRSNQRLMWWLGACSNGTEAHMKALPHDRRGSKRLGRNGSRLMHLPRVRYGRA